MPKTSNFLNEHFKSELQRNSCKTFDHNLCCTMATTLVQTEQKIEQMYCDWMLLKILHFNFIRIVCLPMENTMLVSGEGTKRHDKVFNEQWSSHRWLSNSLKNLYCFYGAAQFTYVLFNSIWFRFALPKLDGRTHTQWHCTKMHFSIFTKF